MNSDSETEVYLELTPPEVRDNANIALSQLIPQKSKARRDGRFHESEELSELIGLARKSEGKDEGEAILYQLKRKSHPRQGRCWEIARPLIGVSVGMGVNPAVPPDGGGWLGVRRYLGTKGHTRIKIQMPHE